VPDGLLHQVGGCAVILIPCQWLQSSKHCDLVREVLARQADMHSSILPVVASLPSDACVADAGVEDEKAAWHWRSARRFSKAAIFWFSCYSATRVYRGDNAPELATCSRVF
jgi:hypothetical protein